MNSAAEQPCPPSSPTPRSPGRRSRGTSEIFPLLPTFGVRSKCVYFALLLAATGFTQLFVEPAAQTAGSDVAIAWDGDRSIAPACKGFIFARDGRVIGSLTCHDGGTTQLKVFESRNEGRTFSAIVMRREEPQMNPDPHKWNSKNSPICVHPCSSMVPLVLENARNGTHSFGVCRMRETPMNFVVGHVGAAYIRLSFRLAKLCFSWSLS